MLDENSKLLEQLKDMLIELLNEITLLEDNIYEMDKQKLSFKVRRTFHEKYNDIYAQLNIKRKELGTLCKYLFQKSCFFDISDISISLFEKYGYFKR
jgi:hypothetical protein